MSKNNIEVKDCQQHWKQLYYIFKVSGWLQTVYFSYI